ncbi:MAG: hypothetical protein AAFV07_07435, partial [Bacteroidota bacterium]
MKTPLLTIILFTFFPLLSAQSKLVEIRFYGYENPEAFPEAPFVQENRQQVKDLPEGLFQFSELDYQPDIPPIHQSYYVSLIFKDKSRRNLQFFRMDSEIFIRENNKLWQAFDWQFHDLMLLLYTW